MIDQLQKFIQRASQGEREMLAVMTGTSIAYLNHVAKGRRNCGADLAISIECATSIIAKQSVGRLKPISRYVLCPTFRRLRAMQRLGMVA